MNPTLSKTLKVGIPLGIGVFLIIYVYSKFTPQQLDELSTYFEKANYSYVILAVLLSILSHISRAYRWRFLMEPLGYKMRMGNSFMSISVAYLMNLFIPKSGEISRGIIIDKYENIPFEKGFGTIISERIVDLIFLLFFTLLALTLNFNELYEYLEASMSWNTFYILSGLGFIGFIALFLFLKYATFPFALKIKTFLLGLKDGVLSILKMQRKGPFILHTFIIWGLYILSFYVTTFALEATSAISFSSLIIAFVVGSFTFAFTNSGFGTYPAAIAGILVLFAVPFTVGTAFGWIIWGSNIISIIALGVVSLIYLPIYNQKKG